MKLNPVYFKSKYPARAHQNENKVPFKEIIPLVLKNYVTGKTKSTSEGKCLFEMSLLLSCWKENQYKDTLCTQQLQNFNICYQNFVKEAEKQKKLKKVDLPSPDMKIFTAKQISYMLRMYPTV